MNKAISNQGLSGQIVQLLPETKTLAKIALPLILASLVNMSISITDVLMMGWLGTDKLAAGAIVSDYYSIFFYFCAGILAASSALIARARGRKQHRRIRHIVQQGFMMALLLALPGAVIVYHADVVLQYIGIEQSIINTGMPYAKVMAITFTVMLLVNVLHHFLAAHQKTRIILMVTALTMPLNALGNYILMFGYGDIAPMGLAGAALSSLLSALFMLISLSLYVSRSPALSRYRLSAGLFRQKPVYGREIFRVGLPIGISNLGEMGVFLLSTVTMGVFGTEVLAAHTVALRMAGVVFALPMGFAQAATVRVGFAIGSSNHGQVMTTVKAALLIAAGCGLFVIAGLIGFAPEITRAFISGPVPLVVMNQAVLFLTILAIGEPFTNLGSVSAGILRAYRDTRMPMVFSLIAYWVFAFAGGWSAAFVFGQGGTGIWAGLTSGCIIYGLLMAARLRRHFAVNEYQEPQLLKAAA